MANHSSLGFRDGEWRLLDSEKEDLDAFGFRAGGIGRKEMEAFGFRAGCFWIQSWLTRRIERARLLVRESGNKRFQIETRGLLHMKALIFREWAWSGVRGPSAT